MSGTLQRFFGVLSPFFSRKTFHECAERAYSSVSLFNTGLAARTNCKSYPFYDRNLNQQISQINAMRTFSAILTHNASYFLMKTDETIPNKQSIRNLNFSGQIGDDMEKLMKIDRIHQIHGGPVKRKKKVSKMGGCPQLKGIVLKTLIQKPRKPNSANRKCCKVRLSTGKEVIAFIPGEGHNLQEHNVVLVNGKRCKDLIGVHYRVIRGKYDCAHVVKKTER